MTNQIPEKGKVVIFSKTPNGSYLTAGVPYFVESVTKRDTYFRNKQTGSGSFDANIIIKRTSEWSYAPVGWDTVGTDHE